MQARGYNCPASSHPSKPRPAGVSYFWIDPFARNRLDPLRGTPPAWWQSGHAADCKSVYAGSIPTQASIRQMAKKPAAMRVFCCGVTDQDIRFCAATSSRAPQFTGLTRFFAPTWLCVSCAARCAFVETFCLLVRLSVHGKIPVTHPFLRWCATGYRHGRPSTGASDVDGDSAGDAMTLGMCPVAVQLRRRAWGQSVRLSRGGSGWFGFSEKTLALSGYVRDTFPMCGGSCGGMAVALHEQHGDGVWGRV
mgnify:CR=1 FL=1